MNYDYDDFTNILKCHSQIINKINRFLTFGLIFYFNIIKYNYLINCDMVFL
jgi:hypothetical protein